MKEAIMIQRRPLPKARVEKMERLRTACRENDLMFRATSQGSEEA